MVDTPPGDGTVPDTLSLEDRARTALNALTRCLDADDGRPYMTADLTASPPSLAHSSWDYGSSVGRLVSSIALAREMTGADTGRDVEADLRERLLDMFDDDGLNYRAASEHTEPRANMHDQRSVLLGLVTWYMQESDPDVRDAADDLCAALRRIAVKEGHPHLEKQDFWYFPAVEYTRDGWPSPDTIYLGLATDPAHTSARMINPLARYHELTGNHDALDLSREFTRHTVEYSGAFNDDGSFNDGVEFRTGHFHSRMVSVTAIARYALTADDAATLDWAATVYDWALSQGTAFGWFPGALREDYVHKHETCALVDMIELGILLAEHGYPEHWGRVERFVRNHLAGTQLRDTAWLGDDEVAERLRGAFPGWAAPNDFVCDVGDDPDVMTCCVAAGTRGLFLAWHHAVTTDGDDVSVNLLLNRETPAVDVYSYLPHEGRVVVDANRDVPRLRVRVPSWVDPARVSVSGAERDGWEGDFLRLSNVADGDRLSVSFPVRDAKTTATAADRSFNVTWRGDTVVDVAPEGDHHPLYADRTVRDEAGHREADLRRRWSAIEW
ncbi:MAG: hypothetical protein ABEJ68_06865 [Halobacteriaceae archaeon]